MNMNTFSVAAGMGVPLARKTIDVWLTQKTRVPVEVAVMRNPRKPNLIVDGKISKYITVCVS